jgi:predicted kinase
MHRLGPEGYSSEVSERVYATVAERAKRTIQGGHTAIVDAVYARPGDRRAIEHVAGAMAVPFAGIWLEATQATLIARVEQRRHDASDANADVIRLQHAQQTGATGWHRIDASGSPEEVLGHAVNHLQAELGGAINTLSVPSER